MHEIRSWIRVFGPPGSGGLGGKIDLRLCHLHQWRGRVLPRRGRASTDIHYRLYARPTGALLSFGTTNDIDALVQDVLRTHAEHPDVPIVAEQLDGPAWQ